MQPIRKDPAGFKTTELKNARILAGIVDDFEELFLRVLEGKAGRQLAQLIEKPVPASSYMIAAELFKAAEMIEKYIDDNAAPPAATNIVASSVAHGRMWADKSLGALGYTQAPMQGPTKVFYLPPEAKMISMYQERVTSEIKGLTNAQSLGIQRAIAKGFQAGETVNQLVKRVQEVTPMAKNKAITIARTETLAAGNAAAKERYKTVGVEMVEWVAAYDDRVCEECEGKHGNVYPIDETPEIPIHPNCRCTLVPVMEME